LVSEETTWDKLVALVQQIQAEAERPMQMRSEKQ
jgi:hypothetical protein